MSVGPRDPQSEGFGHSVGDVLFQQRRYEELLLGKRHMMRNLFSCVNCQLVIAGVTITFE